MFTWAVLIVGLAAGSPGTEEIAWRKLHRGMTPAQVERIVGVPLLRNAARGHELWTYDGGANAQFHGGVLSAWTAPEGTTPPPAPKLPPKSSAQRSTPSASAVAS